MYADVGTCVLIHPEGDYSMLSGFLNGLLYVKGACLHYTTVAGKMFWCECVGSEWRVADIKRVEVVTGNVTLQTGQRGLPRHFTMNPGLKIRFRDHNTLMVVMPDAVNLCAQLKEYVSSVRSAERRGSEDRERALSASQEFTASLDMYTPATANFVTVTPIDEAVTHTKEDQESL
jgi:hypothetical protein